MPKDHVEQWIDEPFETPPYPSEADMHKCACVEWIAHEDEGWDSYLLQGGLNTKWVRAEESLTAPAISAATLVLYEYASDDPDAQVYLEIGEATYNSGVPDQPDSGYIRLYCDGGELWIIRDDGSTTQLS